MSGPGNDDNPLTRRLFVAINPPQPVSQSLASLAEPHKGIRWAHPGTLHLTLRFIGDTAEPAIEPLVARFRAIKCEPFVFTIGGIGVFPSRGVPKVIWAGLENAHPRLFQLRQQIDDSILAAGLSPAMRSFHPHVSLARCGTAQPNAVFEFLRRHRDFQGPSFQVDCFHLIESRLMPVGAEHTIIGTFSLAPG